MEDSISDINTLKELILDQGNLVTYISLSKHLGVHINRSKCLLRMFLKSIREEMPQIQLNVNYLLSGIIEESKAKLTVCPESELETLQKTYKVVHFQHIYSIGQGLPKTDHAALVTLNKYNDFNLCSGIMRSDCCIKRSSNEISNLKSSSQEVPDQKPILTQKISAKKLVTKTEKINVDQKEVKIEPIKKEIVSPLKENFSKQSINKSGAQKGIAGFFNKQNGHAKKKENKEWDKISNPIVKNEENNVQDKMDIDDAKEEKAINIEVKTNHERSGNNKILNQIKKNSKVDKKRKRVLHVSDSESEGENDPFVDSDANEIIHESDDEIPPTPAANNLKITTGITNPRKKRKVVDKTYMSEDGYIVTKREEIYESYSDGESNVEKEPIKKEVKEKSKPAEVSPISKANEIKTKKKISPPQKGKQSSIMNFFKKN